jgi:hypothetical protein
MCSSIYLGTNTHTYTHELTWTAMPKRSMLASSPASFSTKKPWSLTYAQGKRDGEMLSCGHPSVTQDNLREVQQQPMDLRILRTCKAELQHCTLTLPRSCRSSNRPSTSSLDRLSSFFCGCNGNWWQQVICGGLQAPLTNLHHIMKA